MANVGPTVPNIGIRKWVLDTTAVIDLGTPNDRTLGTFEVEVKPVGAGGSFIPKQTADGTGYSGSDLKSCIYYTSDSETVVTAGTSHSAAKILYIPSDGARTYLDYTQGAGTMEIHVRSFIG